MELPELEEFLSILRLSEGNYVPFARPKEIVRRPTGDQISGLMEAAIPPNSARPIKEVMNEAQDIFSYGLRVGHSRFFSFVPSPASPVSWLGDAVTSAFNAFGGSWEAGTGVCTVERRLVGYIAEELFGLPSSAGGQFVSGGSTANLTALVVARDRILGEDPIQRSKGIAYISDQAHFSVAKALKIAGVPGHNIRVISSNAQFRTDIAELRMAIKQDVLSGSQPFVIVATCGTTNTGSIDPLDEIAEIARTYEIWMHVDAAYGGSVAFSKTHKAIVKGIQNADSIAWDAHKWLFQTHGCSMVAFRNRTHPLKSFASTAHYVTDIEWTDSTVRDPWNYGIELTRPARHMRLWFTLQVLGMDTIDQMISRGFYLSRLAETELKKLSDWEIISPSQMAILNFRFAPSDRESVDAIEIDRINSTVSKELTTKGVAAMFTTRLKGTVSLRMCTINPQTTDDEIRYVVKSLDCMARELYQAGRRTSCKI